MAGHIAVTDVLADLAEVEAIRVHCDRARTALDAASWDRSLAKADDDFWTGVRRYCGYASASLDGAVMPSDPLAEPDHSAMGRVSLAALMLTAQADAMAKQVRTTPGQVWARLHSIADTGVERGRPRGDDTVEDPLHLGPAPSAAAASTRLSDLSQVLVSTHAPGVLVAAIAHAELATVRPFTHGSSLVARAVPRMVLAAWQLDTRGAAAVEAGFAATGRARYVRALKDYARGNVPDYVAYFADSVEAGLALTSSLHRNRGFPK